MIAEKGTFIDTGNLLGMNKLHTQKAPAHQKDEGDRQQAQGSQPYCQFCSFEHISFPPNLLFRKPKQPHLARYF
jgi:hypothetical protein